MKVYALALWGWIALCLIPHPMAQATGGLQLETVWASVDQHHPKIHQALAKKLAAEGQLRAARGAFDPHLKSTTTLIDDAGGWDPAVDISLTQATPLLGTRLWATFENQPSDGEGSYRAVDPAHWGRLEGGLSVPLLKDRQWDANRTAIRVGERELERAEAQMESTRLALRQGATDAYFAWLAAGRRVQVYASLLELAKNREIWVETRVTLGALAPVDHLEAQRATFRRQASLIAAERSLQAAALKLALYHRDAAGEPQRPPAEALPRTLSMPAPLGKRAQAPEQLACHPLIGAQDAKVRAAQAQLDLAQAQNAPQLDLIATFSHDIGNTPLTAGPTTYSAGAHLSLPLRMRAAQGKRESAEAKLMAAKAHRRLVADQLTLALLDTHSAYDAAHQQWQLTTAMLNNARALAQAEEKRLKAGLTTLFILNQREQALVEAEASQINAIRSLWTARAQWDALTPCPLD